MYTASLYAVTGASFVALVLLRWREYRRALRSIQYWPGKRIFFSSSSVVANILPPIKYVAAGQAVYMKQKHSGRYDAIGWDMSAEVSVLSGTVIVSIADAQAVQEIFLSRQRFPKPVEMYSTLRLLGENVVVTEGDIWKRHRKICVRPFSEQNNKLVWEESVRVTSEALAAWGDAPQVETAHAVQLTMKITLLVLAAASFGRGVAWTDSSAIPAGHSMSFGEAVEIVAHNMIVKLTIPDPLLGLTQHWRRVRSGFSELKQYMREMIKERELGEKAIRYDLLSGLLDASSNSEDSYLSLSQDELLGNVFIFLMAGHETTANTLAFALALLALYPDEQEALYQDVQAVLHRAGGPVPRYEDVNAFRYTAAVLQETLRLFPPVMGIPKVAAEASTLTVGGVGKGEARTSISVPAGTYVVLDVNGLHRNPRYWREPEAFLPARFLEADWPRDAFIAFAAGARGFAEVESIAFLSMFVSQFKIDLTPEYAARPGETIEQRRERLCDSTAAFSMTPKHLPLVFTRR